MKLYTIRDQVAGFFINPYCAANDGVAKRMFISSLSDSFPHRSDFSLHCIGTFNDETGQLTAENPHLVLSGLSIDDRLDPRVHTNKEIQQ